MLPWVPALGLRAATSKPSAPEPRCTQVPSGLIPVMLPFIEDAGGRMLDECASDAKLIYRAINFGLSF